MPRKVTSTRPPTGNAGRVMVTGVPPAVGAPTLTAPHVPLVSTTQIPLDTGHPPGGTVTVTCAPSAAWGARHLLQIAFQTMMEPGAACAGPVIASVEIRSQGIWRDRDLMLCAGGGRCCPPYRRLYACGIGDRRTPRGVARQGHAGDAPVRAPRPQGRARAAAQWLHRPRRPHPIRAIKANTPLTARFALLTPTPSIG